MVPSRSWPSLSSFSQVVVVVVVIAAGATIIVMLTHCRSGSHCSGEVFVVVERHQ